MGVSSSDLHDPKGLENLALTLLRQNHTMQTPLMPRQSRADIQLIPRCNHDMMNLRTNMMGAMPGICSIGGGAFMSPRGPGFGYEDYVSRRPQDWRDGQPHLCGHCGNMAHDGFCENSYWRRGGSRPRYLRGGDGGVDNRNEGMVDALNHVGDGFFAHAAVRQNTLAGCGPRCSANDGSIPLKGRVGNYEIDLKVGGTPKCPCDSSGGCEHTHRQARSRSRSRERRHRREHRRLRRQQDPADYGSVDSSQSRGRRRERDSPQRSEPAVSAETSNRYHWRKEMKECVKESIKQVLAHHKDLEELKNQMSELREQISTPPVTPNMPVPPDYAMPPEQVLPPNQRPYWRPIPGFDPRALGYNPIAVRGRRPRPMDDMAMEPDPAMSGGLDPFSGIDRRPFDRGFDDNRRDLLGLDEDFAPRRSRRGRGGGEAFGLEPIRENDEEPLLGVSHLSPRAMRSKHGRFRPNDLRRTTTIEQMEALAKERQREMDEDAFGLLRDSLRANEEEEQGVEHPSDVLARAIKEDKQRKATVESIRESPEDRERGRQRGSGSRGQGRTSAAN